MSLLLRDILPSCSVTVDLEHGVRKLSEKGSDSDFRQLISIDFTSILYENEIITFYVTRLMIFIDCLLLSASARSFSRFVLFASVAGTGGLVSSLDSLELRQTVRSGVSKGSGGSRGL